MVTIFQEFGNKREDYQKSNIEYKEEIKYKYKIECTDCNQVFYRQRNNKNFTRKYRCGKCGGKFKITELVQGEDMENKVKVLRHSSIRISGNKIIYIDPFRIEKEYNDADYIFCTHSHDDHFSEEDIRKVIKDGTIIITVGSSKTDALKITKTEEQVVIVEPNNKYKVQGIEFETTCAYNENKKFHPKEEKWVGYIITLDGTKYYIAGDTDNIKEIQDIKCDVALIPIGGTYTMDYKEAAELANKIDTKMIIPTHYGEIVGSKDDAIKFKELVKGKEVEVQI